MTFAIFTRSDMVVNPGWPQVVATLLVFIGTSGHHVRHVRPLRGRSSPSDIPLRIGLAAVAFVVLLLHPSDTGPMIAAAIVVPASVFGIWRHVQLGGPEGLSSPQDTRSSAPPRGGRTGAVQHQE